MLTQLVAWLFGAPLILLTLAYATIFTALLAAKYRQTHRGFERSETVHPIPDSRGAAQIRVNQISMNQIGMNQVGVNQIGMNRSA
jgi:hypothetical protein